MDEVEQKTTESKGLEFDQTGFCAFDTKDGWRFFFRVKMHVAATWAGVRKLGLAWQESEAESFLQGVRASERFQNNVEKLADEFCQAFVEKLLDEGFRVTWSVRRKQELKDGKNAGPGVAVWIARPNKDDDREVSRIDVGNVEAIALGNAMNFCRDEVRLTVTGLEYGILSGGRIYEALVEDPEGTGNRKLIERLGIVSQDSASAVELKEIAGLFKELRAIQDGFEGQYAERKITSPGRWFTAKVTQDGKGKLVLSWQFNKHVAAILTILRIDGPGFSEYTYDDKGRVIGFSGSPLIESTEDNSVPQQLEPGKQCSFSLILWERQSGSFWSNVRFRHVIDRLDFVQPMLPFDENQEWEEALQELVERLTRKSKMRPMQDDGEVWAAIREEIETACPAFERLNNAVVRNVFHRIKVRLQLEEDE